MIVPTGSRVSRKMAQVDLATLDAEPDSQIRSFNFHGCTGGVSAFRGRPPWELHGAGDELLLILAGQSRLTPCSRRGARRSGSYQSVSSPSSRKGTGIPTTPPRE